MDGIAVVACKCNEGFGVQLTQHSISETAVFEAQSKELSLIPSDLPVV